MKKRTKVEVAPSFEVARNADENVRTGDASIALAGWRDDRGGHAVSGTDGISVAGRSGCSESGTYGVALSWIGGTAKAGGTGVAFVRQGGSATAGDGSVAFAGGDRGSAAAGNGGVAKCSHHGEAHAGIEGIAVCGTGRARAGADGIAVLRAGSAAVGTGGIAIVWNTPGLQGPADEMSAGAGGLIITFAEDGNGKRIPVIGYSGTGATIQEGIVPDRAYRFDGKAFRPSSGDN
jgi:hypothetical protein